jgi:hypothetical protein
LVRNAKDQNVCSINDADEGDYDYDNDEMMVLYDIAIYKYKTNNCGKCTASACRIEDEAIRYLRIFDICIRNYKVQRSKLS